MIFKRKPKLTKEQQDNVVRWIVRGYNISSIEFEKFSRDPKTGYFLLSIKLNNCSKLKTTLDFRSIERFNDSNGEIGLNPINRFLEIERNTILEKNHLWI